MKTSEQLTQYANLKDSSGILTVILHQLTSFADRISRKRHQQAGSQRAAQTGRRQPGGPAHVLSHLHLWVYFLGRRLEELWETLLHCLSLALKRKQSRHNDQDRTSIQWQDPQQLLSEQKASRGHSCLHHCELTAVFSAGCCPTNSTHSLTISRTVESFTGLLNVGMKHL